MVKNLSNTILKSTRDVSNKIRNLWRNGLWNYTVKLVRTVLINYLLLSGQPKILLTFLVQEIENNLIDNESPEEVEEEMIGGLDYNEKIAEQQHDDHHVHGENCSHDHDNKQPSELTPEEETHRKHKAYLEWLFNRLAGLETEVTEK